MQTAQPRGCAVMPRPRTLRPCATTSLLYPVKTGFDWQIEKCATELLLFPRTSVTLTVTEWIPALRPFVWTPTESLFFVGFPENVTDLIVFPANVTVTLRRPEFELSAIGKLTVAPAARHAASDATTAFGGVQVGVYSVPHFAAAACAAGLLAPEARLAVPAITATATINVKMTLRILHTPYISGSSRQ